MRMIDQGSPTGATLGWGACLGKVHRDGLRVLREHGWREVPATTGLLPAFTWMSRRSGDFPAEGDGLPLVRQLPQSCTAVLDDKKLLAQCMAPLVGIFGYYARSSLHHDMPELTGYVELQGWNDFIVDCNAITKSF